MNSGRDVSRWGGSLAMVLTLHAGAVAGMLTWQTDAPPSAPPPAAIMVELAPLPTAPQSSPADKPAEKRQEIIEKPQPKRPDPLPKAPVVKKAEVAVNKPKEKPPEKPAEKELPQTEVAAAPPSVAAPRSEAAAAPAEGASLSQPSNAVPTWQGMLVAHLERHKRYPRGPQLRRQQGVAHVAFTIDRQGNVVAHRLHKSSGYDALDEEALALLQRAQPLPPPPPELSGESLDLIVPVQFFLK